jgi:hypothetical protein
MLHSLINHTHSTIPGELAGWVRQTFTRVRFTSTAASEAPVLSFACWRVHFGWCSVLTILLRAFE